MKGSRMKSDVKERLDAWYDDNAICVVAIGSHGDPLDLAEHESKHSLQSFNNVYSTRGVRKRNDVSRRVGPLNQFMSRRASASGDGLFSHYFAHCLSFSMIGAASAH